MAVLGSVIAVAFCMALLVLLGALVRFSIFGGARTKGWQRRLHQPQRSEVEDKWHVTLPESIETYFRNDVTSRSDFYLAPPGLKHSQWWYIERFIPLTCRDLSEWMRVSGVPGIPLAIDGGAKGTYYLPFEFLRQEIPVPVLLRLPGAKKEEKRVASSFEEFTQFEPRASAN